MRPNTRCQTCNRGLYRSPSKVGKFIKNYCNKFCRTSEKISWIAFIYSHQSDMTAQEISTHIGIPRATLRTWVFLINKHMPDEMLIKFRKVPAPKPKREKPSKAAKMPKPAVVKTVKPKKEKLYHRTSRKVPDKPKPTRIPIPFDPSRHTMVRIDNKTWKQVLKTA